MKPDGHHKRPTMPKTGGDPTRSLKAMFASYRVMRRRVDVLSEDLERFHQRVTLLALTLAKNKGS